MAGSAITALASLTLSTTQTTVTFSSISSAYRDLRLIVNATTTAGGSATALALNGDSGGTTYSFVGMMGSGSAASSYSSASTGWLWTAVNYNELESTPDIVTYDFLDYSATDKYKTVLIRANQTSAGGPGTSALTARWANTAAVTTILVNSFSSAFAAGSTFTLYGVSA